MESKMNECYYVWLFLVELFILFLSIVDNMINVCDKYVICFFMLKYNLKSNDFWSIIDIYKNI